MSPQHTRPRNSKFTKGEKCIFAHLIITFVIIIALIIVYFVHLCLVRHTRSDVFQITRRTHDTKSEVLAQYSIGVVYLNASPSRMLCNTLLLKQRWSLAPAQCSAMRTDPDMAQFLLLWKIIYQNGGDKYFGERELIQEDKILIDITDTDIKRTLTHSHFNRDDYNNNIGLFEHQDPIDLKEYAAPNNYVLNYEIFESYDDNNINILDWKLFTLNTGNKLNGAVHSMRSLSRERCSIFVTPIIDQLRSYEFCLTFERSGPALDHGALVVMNSSIVGFFSWGDISGRGVPLIILDIIHFRDWFENIISL